MKLAGRMSAMRGGGRVIPAAAMPERTRSERGLILIVEDDDGCARTLGRFLRARGFITARATNGQRALDFLRNTLVSPSLIFLDLLMPIVDGWRFREAQLRQGFLTRVPVIALAEEPVDEEYYGTLRASGFLLKPFHLPTLQRLLDAIVNDGGDRELPLGLPGGGSA